MAASRVLGRELRNHPAVDYNESASDLDDTQQETVAKSPRTWPLDDHIAHLKAVLPRTTISFHVDGLKREERKKGKVALPYLVVMFVESEYARSNDLDKKECLLWLPQTTCCLS